MSLKHFMLDLETVAIRTRAAPLSCALVPFDLHSDEPMPLPASENAFPNCHWFIDTQECLDNGMRADMSTLDWWFKQSPAVRSWAFAEQHRRVFSINSFCQNFNACLNTSTRNCTEKDIRLWVRNVKFDIPILEHLYEVAGKKFPFRHDAVRCCYTLLETGLGSISVSAFKETHPEYPLVDQAHNPVMDCWNQIQMLRAAKRSILNEKI